MQTLLIICANSNDKTLALLASRWPSFYDVATTSKSSTTNDDELIFPTIHVKIRFTSGVNGLRINWQGKQT